MKKMIVLAGLILGFSVMTMSVSAQAAASADKSTTVQSQQASPASQGKFVDTNKDGICDNHQNSVKNGKCTNFIDKNGDGKCDNCKGDGTCVKGNCCGKEMGKGNCCPSKSGQGMQKQAGKENCPSTCKTPCKK